MKAIEETVVIAVPVSRAYEGWTEFQSLPAYLVHPQSSPQSTGSHSTTEEPWWHGDSKAGAGTDQRTAWLILAGNSDAAGVVVFSPLDAGNTRVSVRFTWPPAVPGPGPGITGARILADLVRFKDFMESLPALR